MFHGNHSVITKLITNFHVKSHPYNIVIQYPICVNVYSDFDFQSTSLQSYLYSRRMNISFCNGIDSSSSHTS